MKENSIEEDIKILEEMIENANIENMDMNNCFGGEHIEAIEHILSDYKKMLKEIEELKEKYDKDTHTLQNQLDIADNDTTEIFCDDDKFEIDAFGDEVDCDEDCQECVLQYLK